jgi:hypothetical protein
MQCITDCVVLQVSMRPPTLRASVASANEFIVNSHPPERSKREAMEVQEMCRATMPLILQLRL